MKPFSSKIIQAMLILAFFFVFIVLPSVDQSIIDFIPISLKGILNVYIIEPSTEMYFGIFHINSILFVGFTAFFLYLSINRDIKKANKQHKNKDIGFKEVENILEEYFFDKINLDEVKSKGEKNKQLNNLLKILDHGGIEEDLLLEVRKTYSKISSSYEKLKNDYEYLATVMPIIGMIGTIAGLLIMFAEPTQAEDFEKKFAGLSLALSTTLYASLITILFFKPNARSIEHWHLDLEKDLECLEISIQRFYHKVELQEFVELPNTITDEKQDVKYEETKN